MYQYNFLCVLRFILQLGDYQCKAENDVGEALKTITVAGGEPHTVDLSRELHTVVHLISVENYTRLHS